MDRWMEGPVNELVNERAQSNLKPESEPSILSYQKTTSAQIVNHES